MKKLFEFKIIEITDYNNFLIFCINDTEKNKMLR